MKKKKCKSIFFIILFILIMASFIYFVIYPNREVFYKTKNKYYLKNSANTILTYDENYKESKKTLSRGLEVKKVNDIKKTNYVNIIYDTQKYIISKDNLTNVKDDIVLEKEMYVRTPVSIYEKEDNIKIIGLAIQNDKLEILGYDKINRDGSVNMYKVKTGETTGFVYSKYLEYSIEKAKSTYQDYNEKHKKSGSSLGGGVAYNLDYYPFQKGNFKDNKMPKEVNALYLNNGRNIIGKVDEYIKLVKNTRINAFVVDIKDNEAPGYKSPVMEKYSPTNYKYANNSLEEYKSAIKKIKDAGFYAIGRITVFKDKYYAIDNPKNAIGNAKTGEPFLYANTYWPSPYNRDVWEFNVSLAIEGIKEIGFNEINFDYIRFPDRTITYEKNGEMDFKNIYNEEKVQAIQRFLMYACDEIHKVNGYVSGDVFGEAAHKYVTAYGQYYGAMSNVLDVISPMPYPDHFSNYEYGFKVPVYTVPYELLDYWANTYVMWHQQNIPTPAISRSWIQTYDSYKNGGYHYGFEEVDGEIRALYKNGLNGGYMTWNSGSNLEKYKELIEIWKKDYK